jgi:hypothetical protein
MVRAMKRRAVMKLSAKCRSGRERLRVVAQRPSGRGGKTPHAFSDDERVAAEGDGDVVVPAGEASSFEVVEPDLALQVFVDTLRQVISITVPSSTPNLAATCQRPNPGGSRGATLRRDDRDARNRSGRDHPT